jgi:hypothetical protein
MSNASTVNRVHYMPPFITKYEIVAEHWGTGSTPGVLVCITDGRRYAYFYTNTTTTYWRFQGGRPGAGDWNESTKGDESRLIWHDRSGLLMIDLVYAKANNGLGSNYMDPFIRMIKEALI